MSAFERFWSFVDIRGGRECWEWMGLRDNNGYGIPDAGVQIAFREPLAHRVACLLMHPRPSDAASDEVLHSCDNPTCCNPRHLRWGSRLENAHDKRLAAWARMALSSRDAGESIVDTLEGERVSAVDADARAPEVIRKGLRRVDEPLVRSIRADAASGAAIRDIANKYGLTQSHTDSIVKRRLWKRVA